MRWAAALALALALAWAATASAQTNNPVVSHYRAYRTAFDAGRYAQAEAPAEAALAAAEAAGDSRAGVLALNLAVLRALKLQKLRQAAAPARRALALGGEGVDSDQTRLLIALSELPQRGDASSGLLQSGIAEALAQPSPATGFLYEVSVAWGVHDLDQGRVESAERAFAFAVQLSEHDHSDVDKAVALTGRGAARTLQKRWIEAATDLNQALRLILPYASARGDGSPTPAHRALGQAWAWRTYVSLRSDVPNSSSPFDLLTALDLVSGRSRPICPGRVIPNPLPGYPNDALMGGGEGIVILWFNVNEAGELQNLTVLGAVPLGGFPESVMRVAPRWRFRWDEGATDCIRRYDRVIAPVRFVIRP